MKQRGCIAFIYWLALSACAVEVGTDATDNPLSFNVQGLATPLNAALYSSDATGSILDVYLSANTPICAALVPGLALAVPYTIWFEISAATASLLPGSYTLQGGDALAFGNSATATSAVELSGSVQLNSINLDNSANFDVTLLSGDSQSGFAGNVTASYCPTN